MLKQDDAGILGEKHINILTMNDATKCMLLWLGLFCMSVLECQPRRIFFASDATVACVCVYLFRYVHMSVCTTRTAKDICMFRRLCTQVCEEMEQTGVTAHPSVLAEKTRHSWTDGMEAFPKLHLRPSVQVVGSGGPELIRTEPLVPRNW